MTENKTADVYTLNNARDCSVHLFFKSVCRFYITAKLHKCIIYILCSLPFLFWVQQFLPCQSFLPLNTMKKEIKTSLNALFLCFKLLFPSSTFTQFIYHQCSLSVVGWGCCQSPSCCHWLRSVRQKKKSSWRHLFSWRRKKKERKKPSPPVWETETETDLSSVLRLPLAGSLYKI